jgi:hypothetical protein
MAMQRRLEHPAMAPPRHLRPVEHYEEPVQVPMSSNAGLIAGLVLGVGSLVAILAYYL